MCTVKTALGLIASERLRSFGPASARDVFINRGHISLIIHTLIGLSDPDLRWVKMA